MVDVYIVYVCIKLCVCIYMYIYLSYILSGDLRSYFCICKGDQSWAHLHTAPPISTRKKTLLFIMYVMVYSKSCLKNFIVYCWSIGTETEKTETVQTPGKSLSSFPEIQGGPQTGHECVIGKPVPWEKHMGLRARRVEWVSALLPSTYVSLHWDHWWNSNTWIC